MKITVRLILSLLLGTALAVWVFARYQAEREEKRLNGHKRLIGVIVYLQDGDRLDYTKSLLERFRAIERFLERYPGQGGNFAFLLLGAPTRSLIPRYRHHIEEVERLVQSINAKFATEKGVPIVFLKEHHPQDRIRLFYRRAQRHGRGADIEPLHGRQP